MASIEDRSFGKKSSDTTAGYDAMLARSVENLPDSSPTARAAFYERIRAALTAQMKSSQRPISIESELRMLDEAIDRLEARIKQEAPDAQPTSSTASRGPAKSDGWLDDLLVRASRNDVHKTPSTSRAQPELPQRSPRVATLRTSPDLLSRSSGPSLLQVVPARAPSVQEEASFDLGNAQEKPMHRADQLNRTLRKLQHDSPGVEASALISEDGLMIASALSQDMEETRVAGMTATLLNLGSRATIELSRGNVQEVIVRGEHGYAVLISAGRGALLLALTNENAKLGLVFFDMREAVRSLAKVL